MAIDKVVDSGLLDEGLLNIAGAIRNKGVAGKFVFPDGFVSAIDAISVGTDTTDATATKTDILYGKTAYANGEKLEGSFGYKVFTCEVVSDVLGSGAYAVLSSDPVFLEHRTDDNLSIVVTADDPPVEGGTFIQSRAFNKGGVLFGWGSSNNAELKQYRTRYNTNTVAKYAISTISSLCADSADALEGVYSMWISPGGELRLYSGSAGSYAVRAGKYTIEVRW